MTDIDIDAIAAYWQDYLKNYRWRDLVRGIEPKGGGCGHVYELPSHSRPQEELCIADMRHLTISEPHYHPDNHYEIYLVLEGSANLLVGYRETKVSPGMAVIIPPNHTHYAIPDAHFVTAAVNIPGFTPETYIVTPASDPRAEFDLAQFTRLKNGATGQIKPLAQP